jgi:hypothetical protein
MHYFSSQSERGAGEDPGQEGMERAMNLIACIAPSCCAMVMVTPDLHNHREPPKKYNFCFFSLAFANL